VNISVLTAFHGAFFSLPYSTHHFYSGKVLEKWLKALYDGLRSN
jgi:hypothetical protein